MRWGSSIYEVDLSIKILYAYTKTKHSLSNVFFLLCLVITLILIQTRMVKKEVSGPSTISSTTRRWREYCSLHVGQHGKYMTRNKIIEDIAVLLRMMQCYFCYLCIANSFLYSRKKIWIQLPCGPVHFSFNNITCQISIQCLYLVNHIMY